MEDEKIAHKQGNLRRVATKPTRKPPTRPPTRGPTRAPTRRPTKPPTRKPTPAPIIYPRAKTPTKAPTMASPVITAQPGSPVEILAGTTVSLAKSIVGQLMTLTDAAGQSYDGDWECVRPNLLLFPACDTGSCTGNVPAGKAFVLTSRNPQSLTAKERASRLLTQPTFGHTQECIDQVSTLSADQWITLQMQENPTLYRVHTRELLINAFLKHQITSPILHFLFFLHFLPWIDRLSLLWRWSW